jgi:DNA-binding beta-propeller fold protein YncE
MDRIGRGIARTAIGIVVMASTLTAQNAPPFTTPRTPWGDPDLQGTWPGGSVIEVPFERAPELGRRAVLTDTELAARASQMQAQLDNDRAVSGPTVGSPPTGAPSHWLERGTPSRQASLVVDPPDGRLPRFTDDGARRDERWRTTSGDAFVFTRPEDLTAYDRCISRGVLGSAFPNIYSSGTQILQVPGYVVIRHEMIHETRIVPLDGRPRLSGAIRSYMGDSRGHWDGATLVIESTNFNGKTGSYGRNGDGAPTTEDLRLVERLTLADANTLQYEVRVEDAKTFTQPWTVAFPLTRDDSHELYEYACTEGNYAMRNMLSGARASEQAAAAPAPPPPSAEPAPRFRVDPSWPTIPNNWQLGQVASVSVDAADHVWILQRPGTLSADEQRRAAPPLLEFDAAGTFVQGWGGPGPGYEWPTSEHGVYVDPKGFVWIGGNGAKDHQILKFTKTGRFVLQIGRAGQSTGNADTRNLNQPADTFVHAATSELFVADGYGNRRVIVFDADTGAFKRMWGAFGNTPSDAAPNPADADADARGASQFVQPVHATRVSTDGLVYVSDRGGKRVQVFRLDGTYVTQVFIGRDCTAPACGNGTTAASTAFSTDPAQRFLYVGNRSQAKVMVLDRATLEVLETFGEWGSAPGQFGTLHHMAADSTGNLYVTEVTPLAPVNRRVQKFVRVERTR